MSDQDSTSLEAQLEQLKVESVTIRFSARRSIRAVGANGDEFRTAESEESWTIVSPDKAPMSVDLAYAAAMKFTPLLIKKTMFDMVVAGVMKSEDAQKRIKYAKEAYETALAGGKKSNEPDKGTDQQPLHRVGDPLSSAGEEPPEGAAVSPGQDHRVPNETGPGNGHAGGSPEVAPVGQDHRP